ncbi:hypothetical protein [Pseudarthrobacter defluvii]|uniref:hypothetical protein n=1 Tax=Pseudarthrobacter defluvii TaxID=410837 RepID=UPI0025750D3E|nr:hypothetical protein [Pseudarthrobacter defluvii]WJH24005.1 hypothetical protein JCQ34_16525 [Pseudarthrobacter defluvii]
MTSLLQAAILAVDGVTEVFPARNLWQRLPGRVASLVQPCEDAAGDGQLVEVRDVGGRTEVNVRIGVSPDARTPDVVRAVAAAVHSSLSPAEAAVKVTVVRIAPARGGAGV